MARGIGQKVIKIDSIRRGNGFKPEKRTMMIGIIIAVILGVFLAFRPNAYQISINGEVVGAIKDMKIIEGAKETVIAQLSSEYKADVKFADELGLERYRAKKRDYIDPTYLISYMRANMDILINFKEIYIEDESVGIVPSEAEVEELKAELKKKYYGDRDVKVEFGKKVEVKDVFAKESDLISMDKLVQKCTVTTPKSINYKVSSGDTLSGIAGKYNTTVESVIAANPDFAENVVLRIGQEIKVNVNEPVLPLTVIKGESAENKSDDTEVKEVNE